VVGVDAGVITAADGRLVIAVTVLSLALSPIWVVTGRRLHALTARGITSGTELLRLVYGPETELVVKASTRTARGFRAAALWLRKRRHRRRQMGAKEAGAKEADAIEGTPGEEPGARPEVEIIPSGTSSGAPVDDDAAPKDARAKKKDARAKKKRRDA